MPALHASVNAATKAAFLDVATRRGLKESEFLRALAHDLIASDSGWPPTAGVTEGEPVTPPRETTERVGLRLPLALIKAARVRSATKGLVLSRWLAGLIQASVSHEPVTTDRELLHLGETTLQLAAVGRNLNQMAHALNADIRETACLKLGLIEELNVAVGECRAAVKKLAQASLDSWI